MQQSLYSHKVVDNLVDRYIAKGGEVIQMREPVLGCGDLLLFGDGLKTTVINEVYLGMYSSAHTIRRYNRTPAKYQKIIDNR